MDVQDRSATETIEHDLVMIHSRLSLTVDGIIQRGKDLSPRMAYLIDYIDNERNRLAAFIEQQ